MGTPEFEVDIEPVRAGVKMTVRGEIDISTIGRLDRAREQALSYLPRWLLIDLGGVSFVDSSGLKFLLETNAMSREAGWRLKLLKPAASAMRAFAITGTDRHLPFIDLDPE